ncbi:hypothetical protein RclHR1_36330001 [Rhizophagus clarus]|uniref:Uncharacterized protein n=1 Tax=Rhizophagus clarus TaxID=94130 RepID=A0A2Z6RNK5_9GLOM|nr:hypothetical protein RclHR1_36330001 [Rhizophagus clarus]
MPDADALPYLFNQLPSDLEMRVRIANPATVIAFFTDLRNIWHESAGKRIQAHTIAPVNYTAQPQKDDFKIRLTRDLAYTGIKTNDATLENFIYEELKRRLGVVRKVVQKAKQIRNCSICRKASHTKVNCPRLKQTKKVNYVYQNEEENPEDSKEYILEEEDPEEEIEEDDEYINDDDINDEQRNCYALKKKWCEVEEILIEISKFINMMFPKIKDHCLNISMPNDTVKRRELAWGIIASKFENILFPLLQVVNSEQKPLLQIPDNNESIPNASSLNEDMVIADSTKIKEINTTSSRYIIPESIRLAIKAYASAQKKNSQIYWPKPLEINFLQIKDADDVATISCRVGDVTIPYAMIDSGSDSSIVSENVTKHLGLKLNRKKFIDLIESQVSPILLIQLIVFL